jgi:hypothetical protein
MLRAYVRARNSLGPLRTVFRSTAASSPSRQERISGGPFEWNIGTAGSTTMLALSVLPLACFADSPIRARIEGGVFQDFAPVPHHLREVLAPLLRRMGVEIDVRVVRPGYVPGGPGILQITVTPTERGLIGLTLVDPGQVRHVQALPSQAVSPNAASASGWPRRARRRLGRPISCAISSAGMIWRRAIRERTSRSGPRAAVGAGLVQAAPERPDGRRKLSASRRPDVPGRSSERRNGRSAPCGSTGAVCRTGAWPFRLYRPGSDGSRRLERVARASVRRDGEYG